MPTTVVGVDAFRRGKTAGWIAVVLVDGEFVEAELAGTFVDVLDRHPPAQVIGVDIPIGLPQTGRRRADAQARERLRAVGRSSTLFPTPPRRVVETREYEQANQLSREIDDRGISRQSYALFPRILEVESALENQTTVIEVHPEVSFDELAKGGRLERKKSWSGLAQRRVLLEQAGIVLATDLGEAGTVPADDVVDAAVAAWTANRKALGKALRLPAFGAETGEDIDEKGRLMAIWF